MVVFVMMLFGVVFGGRDKGHGSGAGAGSGSESSSDETRPESLPKRRMPRRSSGTSDNTRDRRSHTAAPAVQPPTQTASYAPFACPHCNRQFPSEFPCWQHMAASQYCRERLPEDLKARIRQWENEPAKSKKRKRHSDDEPSQEPELSRAGPPTEGSSSSQFVAPGIGAPAVIPAPQPPTPIVAPPPIMASGGFSRPVMPPPPLPPAIYPPGQGLQALPLRPPPPQTATVGASCASPPGTPPTAVRGPLVYSQAEVHLMIVGAVQAAIQGLLASRAMLSQPKSPRRQPPNNDLD